MYKYIYYQSYYCHYYVLWQHAKWLPLLAVKPGTSYSSSGTDFQDEKL